MSSISGHQLPLAGLPAEGDEYVFYEGEGGYLNWMKHKIDTVPAVGRFLFKLGMRWGQYYRPYLGFLAGND